MKSPIVSSMLLVVFNASILFSQEHPSTKPTVQDLDFLIGTWEINFEFYDTHDPSRGVIFTEKGIQKCAYDLNLNGTPMFIICKGELVSDNGKLKGRKRSFQEAVRYGHFTKSYERVGIYSNWPATAKEILFYDSTSNKMEIRGELSVQRGMLERYEDIYQFNDDYTYYDRKNVANFSDMPITEYNLTLKGTGRKVQE